MARRYCSILLISLLLLGALTSCSAVSNEYKSKEERNSKFNNLLELHDRSERAFMYHHYCLKDEPVNERFMSNFKMTSNLLMDEAVANMKMSPQTVLQRVMSRRELIQQQLSEYYNSLGCQSDEAKTAKTHYRAFSEFSENQVRSLLIEPNN